MPRCNERDFEPALVANCSRREDAVGCGNNGARHVSSIATASLSQLRRDHETGQLEPKITYAAK
jgi:hypothetical protein